jgi:hypothetical protein
MAHLTADPSSLTTHHRPVGCFPEGQFDHCSRDVQPRVLPDAAPTQAGCVVMPSTSTLVEGRAVER